MEAQCNLIENDNDVFHESLSEEHMELGNLNVKDEIERIYIKMNNLKKDMERKQSLEMKSLREEIASHQNSAEDNHSSGLMTNEKEKKDEIENPHNDRVDTNHSILTATDIIGIVPGFVDDMMRETNYIYNTETIHMEAVRVATFSKKPLEIFLTTLRSILTVSVQVYILWYLLLESSNTPCSAHTDCIEGQFCNPKIYKKTARCYDCSIIIDKNVNDTLTKKCDPYKIAIENFRWQYDNIDHQVYRFDAQGGELVTSVFPNYNDTVGECTSYLHCVENDVLPRTCDFVSYNRARLNKVGIITLLFLSIGLASSLASDAEEAAVEETILNHLVDKNSFKMSRIAIISSRIIRMCLRIRRYIMPFFGYSSNFCCNSFKFSYS